MERRPLFGGECLLVAELSANHLRSLSRAKELVRAAKEAGASAVKTQCFTPDTISFDSRKGAFLIRGDSPWAGRTLYELYQEAFMPWEWHAELKALAGSLGLPYFASPFDASAVDFLDKLGVPAFKIASFELVDIPLIEEAARRGKPLIVSTGMGSVAETAEAVAAARGAGCAELALLKCVSGYPSKPEEANLRTIADMASRFGVAAGLSDHSLDLKLPSLAVAAGATIVEKHLTLKRSDGGPDAGFSLEPAEFAEMAALVREAERALGSVSYEIAASEKANRLFRRSLYAVEDLEKGEAFTRRNVRSIRPGDGLHPRHFAKLMELKAKTRIAAGTPLSPELVDGFENGGEAP